MSPLDINGFLVSHNAYIDVDDGVRDDVGWGTISAIDPSITVSATGAGWPSSDNAIVKFHYQSISNPYLPNGQPNMIDHFCLVASAGNRTIVDSWDGITKPIPAAYGAPVSYAEYSLSIPAQPVTPPAPVVSHTGQDLFLPSEAGTWRVYRTAGPWNVGNEIGKLLPGNFPPGLTYHVDATVANFIYAITTESYGQVAIYAGPDTIARWVDPVSTPPPAPTPVPPPAPEPTPAPPQPKLEYTTYSEPISKQAKDPAAAIDLWDVSQALTVGDITHIGTLPAGTIFEAAGDVMTEFGHRFLLTAADLQAKTAHGVYDQDVTDVAPENEELDPTAGVLDEPKPSTDWMKTRSKEGAGEYDSDEEYYIRDISGQHPEAIHLPKGQVVKIVGCFVGPDGKGYYIPQTKTYGSDHWYGIPPEVIGGEPVEIDDDSLFDFATEINSVKKRAPKNLREALEAIAGLLSDLLSKLPKTKKT